MIKTGLYWYVYDFSDDYKVIAMFGFTKKMLLTAMAIFSWKAIPMNALECVSMNNQEYKIRTKIIDINNNEPPFYPYNILVYKCSGSCNSINDPDAKLCASDAVKKIHVKVFNLM